MFPHDKSVSPPSTVNKPPAFHRPPDDLQTFAGENFVFQFTASDPEGSALLFQLEEAPKGAVLSPAGLLIWSVPLVPEQDGERLSRSLFRFTLSDECNAQSSFTVEVKSDEGREENLNRLKEESCRGRKEMRKQDVEFYRHTNM